MTSNSSSSRSGAGGGGKLNHSRSGLRIEVGAEGLSPFMLDEPHWTPDGETPHCEKCDKKFDFFNRRHHCRRCGKLFCSSDCNNKVPLPRFSFVDPVLTCSPCATITKKENEFFDKHLKILLAGGNFNVDMTGAEAPQQFTCKLTKNHKYVEFESGSSAHDNIEITSVTKVQVQTASNDVGNNVVNGVTIGYKDFQGNQKSVTLTACADAIKKQSMGWIAAFQRGMKMIFDS